MKTLVVQGIAKSQMVCENFELTNVFIPCMKTVKQWATRRGYDYKAYSEAKYVEDYGALLDIELSPLANNQFYKYQWVQGHTEYDRIMWVDADVWVWGDPDPLRDEWFCCPVIYREHEPDWMLHDGFPWRRPNFGLFWGSQEGIEHFCTNARERLDDPSKRGDCTNYLLITHRWVHYHGRHMCNMNDEWFMAEWMYDNLDKIRIYRQAASLDDWESDCHWYVNWPNIPEINSFIHLSGLKKHRKIQQLHLFLQMQDWPGTPGMDFLLI